MLCAEVFTGLLARLVAQALPGLRKKMCEPLHPIDSTSFRPSSLSSDWARFSAAACGVKLHVVCDPDADCPRYAALSSPKVNDISAANEMPIDPMATYVFDLGYYDFFWGQARRRGMPHRYKAQIQHQAVESRRGSRCGGLQRPKRSDRHA